jgi:hypothetical protein
LRRDPLGRALPLGPRQRFAEVALPERSTPLRARVSRFTRHLRRDAREYRGRANRSDIHREYGCRTTVTRSHKST